MTRNKLILGLLALFMSFSSMVLYANTGKDLRQAAKSGNIVLVRELLAKGIDANAAGKKGGTALIKAAKEGHLAVVQLLLFNGADPNLKNQKGRSALEVAERNDHTDIVTVMTGGLKEQSIQIPFREMGQDEFVSLMKGVFYGRKYRILKTEPNKITAAYRSRDRLYMVRASMQNGQITLGFLRGYSARKTNYLLNLKKDLMWWENNKIK